MSGFQGWGEGWTGGLGLTVHTIETRQQGPTVEHRELYAILVITYNGKESENVCVCMC